MEAYEIRQEIRVALSVIELAPRVAARRAECADLAGESPREQYAVAVKDLRRLIRAARVSLRETLALAHHRHEWVVPDDERGAAYCSTCGANGDV